jgi:predicted dehydrogenase
MTRALLKHPVPFTIEKPLGQNLAEARAVCQLVEDAGATDRVMVSFNRRYDPALTLGMSWLRQQGPVRFVRASMLRMNRTEPDFIWGTGIHLIDAVCSAVGPLRLWGVVRPCAASVPTGTQDCWRVAMLEGRDGATIVLEIMPDAGQGEEQIRFAGDGYQIDIHTGVVPPWRVRAVKQMNVELDVRAPDDEPWWMTNGTYAETAAFLDAAVAGAPLPPPGIREAMLSTELAAQLQEIELNDRSKACP